MITDALRFLKDNFSTGRTFNSSGREFLINHTGQAELIPNKFKSPTPEPLTLNTLTGFADYIHSGPEQQTFLTHQLVFIHVVNYNCVRLLSGIFGDLHQRNHYAKAVTDETLNTGFDFGYFYSIPGFIIQAQAAFKHTENLLTILNFISNIKADQSQQYKDTGYVQNVSVSRTTGSSIVEDAQVPNPVILQPYRTFHEVDQPESSFVFRIKAGSEDQPPRCALFEASGGAWKLDAIQKIADWLKINVPELPVVA